MNLFKTSTLTILLSLSIDFTNAAEKDKDANASSPNAASASSFLYLPFESSYISYKPTSYSSSRYSPMPSAQAPLTEKEIEFKKLEEDFYNQFHQTFYISSFEANLTIDKKIEMIKQETELKTWENNYRDKFYSSFYCSDYQASPAKKIEMIKEALSLKEAEDAYSKKHHMDFKFSDYGRKTSYNIITSTPEKLKIITEEMEFQDLLRAYFNEFQDMPSISDAAMTTNTSKIKANQIEALKEEIIIKRLVHTLKSATPPITDEELQDLYAQLPAAENSLTPARSTKIEALRAEKQRREIP